MISNAEYAKAVTNFNYCLKKTTYKVSGSVRSLSVIALIDCRTGLIRQVTDYADYLLYRKTTDMSFNTSNDRGLHAVCQFLNYILINNYSKYQIKTIEDVTLQMFKDFLWDYAYSITKQGTHPLKKSVVFHRDDISVFLAMLCHYKKDKMKYLRKNDLIGTQYVIRNGYSQTKTIDFKVKVRYDQEHMINSKILRDMPLEIVERFVKMALIYDPELAFPIVLMCFAGLRESEVCNVRQITSCYGPGLIMSYNDGVSETSDTNGRYEECNSIIIDLTDTLVLRSDGITTGGIKRKRMQSVHPPYVPIISEYYHKHMRLIAKKPHEESGPMFLCKYKNSKTGKYMAMTKSSLRDRINNLFEKHVLPSCENDQNPKLRMYYVQMRNHSWGAHAFRHWFTVSLVLMGCDEVVIQSARGDLNRESAKQYLERKGELLHLYRLSVEVLGLKIRSEEYEDL